MKLYMSAWLNVHLIFCLINVKSGLKLATKYMTHKNNKSTSSQQKYLIYFPSVTIQVRKLVCKTNMFTFYKGGLGPPEADFFV